jgi:hypothetical protein
MPRYEFTVTVVGKGENSRQAWIDARERLNMMLDGLDEDNTRRLTAEEEAEWDQEEAAEDELDQDEEEEE